MTTKQKHVHTVHLTANHVMDKAIVLSVIQDLNWLMVLVIKYQVVLNTVLVAKLMENVDCVILDLSMLVMESVLQLL